MFLENDLPFCYKPNFDIIFKTKSSINTNDDVSRISRLDAPDLGDLDKVSFFLSFIRFLEFSELCLEKIIPLFYRGFMHI